MKGIDAYFPKETETPKYLPSTWYNTSGWTVGMFQVLSNKQFGNEDTTQEELVKRRNEQFQEVLNQAEPNMIINLKKEKK